MRDITTIIYIIRHCPLNTHMLVFQVVNFHCKYYRDCHYTNRYY